MVLIGVLLGLSYRLAHRDDVILAHSAALLLSGPAVGCTNQSQVFDERCTAPACARAPSHDNCTVIQIAASTFSTTWGRLNTFTTTYPRRAGDDIFLNHHRSVAFQHGDRGQPYSFQPQMKLDEITGGSPYGPTTIASGDRSRQPTATELDDAGFQGKIVAETAGKLQSRALAESVN
jgi:hypothetical protein